MRPETRDLRPETRDQNQNRLLSPVSGLLSPVSGVTLLELVVASTLGIAVILALQRIDMLRINLMGEIRRVSSEAPAEAARALSHMAATLEQADRVILVNPGEIRARIPLANDLDNPANYQWVFYRFVGSASPPELQFHRLIDAGDDCTPDDRFLGLTNLVVTYHDTAALAPPGGEPDPTFYNNLVPEQDNNVLTLRVDFLDSQTGATRTYWAGAALRAGTYGDARTGVSDVGPRSDGCG